MSSLTQVVRTQRIVVDPGGSSIGVINAGPVGPRGPIGSQDRYPGEIILFAGPTAPATTLDCDGAEHSRTTYAALYAAIGDTWGDGDGVSTFNVPDLRGAVPMGAGTGVGLTARTLGGSVGVEDVTLTADQSGLPAHNHTQNAHTHIQDAHTHTQNAHTHVQDAHTHTQNSHTHPDITGTIVAHPFAGTGASVSAVPNSFVANDKAGAPVPAATATNQNTTATNQNATATNQNTTATNQNATATNNANAAAPAASAHTNIQPSRVVKYVIQT